MSFSGKWGIVLSPKPSTHSCWDHEVWKSLPCHRAQRVAPLLEELRRIQKLISCRSLRLRGLIQSKAGWSAPAESSTITLLITLLMAISVTELASFWGRHSEKLFSLVLTDIRFCLNFASLPSSLVRLACGKCPEQPGGILLCFFAISAVHESIPYKTHGKLSSAEQSV